MSQLKFCRCFSFVVMVWVLFLLTSLLAACGDDGYYYPSVKLEFLTAFAEADGYLHTVLTDEGEYLKVVEDATGLQVDANTSVRVIGNYGMVYADNGAAVGVKLYAVTRVVAPVPQSADRFEDGVKTDPADMLSIWMGLDYLNMVVTVKAQEQKHAFHFIEEKVEQNNVTGNKEVYLTLYHDSGNDVGYTQRVYLSVPLRQYVNNNTVKVTLHFSLHATSGEVKTYDFDYIPSGR